MDPSIPRKKDEIHASYINVLRNGNGALNSQLGSKKQIGMFFCVLNSFCLSCLPISYSKIKGKHETKKEERA